MGRGSLGCQTASEGGAVPKISAERRLDRRREIADAARRCFVEKGFDATTMSDIVTEAGLSAGAIYLHFENKQDLVCQVVSDLLQERTDEMAELTRRRPAPHPVDVLDELVSSRGTGSMAPLRVHAWSVFLREPELTAIFTRHSALRQGLMAEYARAWLVESGVAPEDASLRADSVATVLVGLFQGALMQLAADPTLTVDRFVDAARWIDFAPAHAAPRRGAAVAQQEPVEETR